jgi:predicted deacylase
MSHKRYPNFLVVAAMNRGIPGFISEPVYRSAHDQTVGVSVRGLLNVMKQMRMLDGPVEPQVDNLVPAGRYWRTSLHSREAGIIQMLKEKGDPVKQGEVIARIRSVLGDVAEEVKSPGDGYFRRVTDSRTVQMGGYVGEIFQVPGPKVAGHPTGASR